MKTLSERQLVNEITDDLREELSTVDEQRLAALVRVQNFKHLRQLAKNLRELDTTALDGLMLKIEIRLLLKQEPNALKIQNAIADILRSNPDQCNDKTLEAVKQFTGICDRNDPISVACVALMLANVVPLNG